MKRFISVAMLSMSLTMIALAQTSMTPAMQNAPPRKSPLAEYAGAWIGMFQGHAWLNIRLTLQANQISGTVKHPKDLQFDNQGELKSVGEEQSMGSVENAVLNGDGLLITVKDPTKTETDRYLMKLTSADTAEIKMVAMSMPPGMPKLKPWKLMRARPNAIAPVH